MKINTRTLPYEEVLTLPRLKHKDPLKPSKFLATVVRIASMPTLWKTKFSYTTERMELVGDEPCLILMNHSSFTDMKLAFGIFYPKRLGIVTSVAPQHLETFKTIERVAKTKYELIEGLPADGNCYFYDDGAYCTQMYEKTQRPKKLCGKDADKCDCWCEDIRVSSQGSTFQLHIRDKGSIECHTRLLGEHNIQNILLAAMAASDLGLTLRQISHGIEKLQIVKNRLELMTRPGAFTIINDAFNSNPVGAKAALHVLKEFPQRRIIITPGMVELGENEAEYNREFGREMARCVDVAILVGKNRTLPMVEGLREAGFPEENIHRVDSLDASTRLLHSMVRPTDTVLYENDLPDHYQEA